MSNGESETAKKATAGKKKTASSGRVTDATRPAKRPRSSAKGASAIPRARTRTAASERARTKSGDADVPVRRRSGGRIAVTQEQRRAMIAEAAYYKAQARGFADGDIVRDWTEAEAEVDAMIARRTDADK